MGFLDSFMGNNDTLKERMTTLDTFGQPLDNVANDVPMYDQYNTGLAVTQENMSDRVNLAVDPRAQPRCGVTGLIPSVEEGIVHGAQPQPRQLVVDMGQLSPEEMELAKENQRRDGGWFQPIVEDTEVMDCPGGICPVPWATDTSGDDLKERPVLIDNVNHPSHYTDGGIECIEAIEAQLTPEEYKGYLKGNVAKYVWRERHKGGIESLKKAQWYLDRLVNLE